MGKTIAIKIPSFGEQPKNESEIADQKSENISAIPTGDLPGEPEKIEHSDPEIETDKIPSIGEEKPEEPKVEVIPEITLEKGEPAKRGRRKKGEHRTLESYDPAIQKQITISAQLSFDMSIGMLKGIFGDEWNPKTPEERQMMITCISNYYADKGVMDISPGWMLVLVATGYSMQRVQQPNTRAKLKMIFVGIKDRIKALIGKIWKKKP